jgi:hypothetical protein
VTLQQRIPGATPSKLPVFAEVNLPPGVSTEPGVATALRCERTNCGRVMVVAKREVKNNGGVSRPCFYCFRVSRIPAAQGSLL